MLNEKGPSRERIESVLNRNPHAWLLDSDAAKTWAGMIANPHGDEVDKNGEMTQYKSLAAKMAEKGLAVPSFDELKDRIKRTFEI